MTLGPLVADVLVVVPTHDHASTLALAVRSALEQSVTDLDVVIVGDGVGDDTRAVADELVRLDPRVRFLDRPKSPSRGEAARHEVLTASGASMVTYLGDDDLLWPDHVASMRALLDGHDFVNPLPLIIDPDGRLRVLPGDLGDPRSVAWHLQPGQNTVSLTGTTHTMDAYRRLPHGWRTPPPDRWSDHVMWEQFLRLPGIRLATGCRATTVKPPASVRVGLGAEARRTALEAWWARMHEPGARERWDDEVAGAVRRSWLDAVLTNDVLQGQVRDLSDGIVELREVWGGHIAHLEAREQELEARQRELEAAGEARAAEIDALQAHLAALHATRTWRLHDRLTSVPLLRRLLARPGG